MQLIREGVQVASLIGAFSAEEITVGELAEALQMLTPEAVRVFSASLACVMVEMERPDSRLVAARMRAESIAATARFRS
ncbi:MAG TPA: hypothetical protein VFA04_23210 [Bryobacteraceae bacterium]|jgi:hypothetical protein|nr:hypothetical protein [Bryobacteraceae bacterium]